jgi:hypothetical protein
MAIPSLPTALNAGDVVSNAWVDSVRDGLELHRDNRPQFRMRVAGESIGGGGVWEDVSFSDGAATSAFVNTPTINVGTFTSEDNGTGVVVPEIGNYQIMLEVEFDIATTGDTMFQIRATRNGSIIYGTRSASHESKANIADAYILNATGLQRCSATTDVIDVMVYQDSGNAMTCDVVLSAVWLGS